MKKTFLFSIKTIPVLFRITALLLLAIMLAVVFCNIDPESRLVDETLYAEEISRAAARHALPQDLVKALIRRESHFNPNAVGSHGEIGLMQLMPSGAVAEWARVKKTVVPSDREVFDVKLNLEIGCWYLARCIKKWKSYKYRCQYYARHRKYNLNIQSLQQAICPPHSSIRERKYQTCNNR